MTERTMVRWQRAEGLAVLFLAAAWYARLGVGWLLFVLLLLAPDLSMAGYLAGPRVGAFVYNLAHSYILPIATIGHGTYWGQPLVLSLGLVWAAHIGIDRALGYGLKSPEGFGVTHLGRVGRAATVVLLGLAAACQPGDAARVEPGDARKVEAGDAGKVEAGAQPVAPSRPALALDGEGFRFVTDGGSARPAAFGDSRERVVAATTEAIGPPDEQGTIADCALDFVSWRSGLSATFRDSAFVGWSIRQTGPFGTMSGVSVGSSRADLEAAYTTEIFESTLGTEFTAGGMAGLLDADTVSHLWAGEVCIAR